VLPGFNGPLSDETLTSDSLHIILDPLPPWESEQTVEVHVVSGTVGGLHTRDETYAFTVAHLLQFEGWIGLR